MGKFVGFIGTISGKVGTTVFQKGEKGLSYGRSYQPVVANPKTIGQTDQRAKMNLAGRMSEVTPKALLQGMGFENNRQRRSEFVSNLLKVAVIDRSTPGSVIAKIAPEDVVFSKGAEIIRASVAAPTIVANQVTIPITLSSADDAGKYGERIIVAVIDPSDKAGYSLVAYKDVVLENTTAVNVQVSLGTNMADGSLVAIYRAPFYLNESGARLRSETLANNGNDITAQLLAAGQNYVRDWGRSVMAIDEVFHNA